MADWDDCLKNRRIISSPRIRKSVKLEIREAERDLKEAKNRFRVSKFKYATTAGYYSLFHSARALLYSQGYRERSHHCLLLAIKELFVKEQLLELKLLKYFEEGLGLREAADYQGAYSKLGAKRAIEGAKEFLAAAKEILNNR